MNTDDYSFGLSGGREYLSEVLKISNNQPPTLKSVREYISKSFDKIDCFLLPHPGLKIVSNKTYDGRWSELTEEFKRQLSNLVEWLLQGKHLNKKKIFGVEQTGATYRDFATSYFKAFQSNKIPEVKSLYETTVESQMLIDIEASVKDYKDRMKQFEYSSSANLLAQIKVDHMKAKDAAITLFDSKPKWGDEEHTKKYTFKLSQAIKRFYNEWANESLRKMREAEVIECALAINTGEYDIARNISEQLSLSGFDRIIEIVGKAYSSDKISNVLLFLEPLTDDTQVYKGYEALYEKMYSKNDLIRSEAFRFAFHMKNRMERTSDQALKNGYEMIKFKLPIILKAIIWSEVVQLKNTYFNNYMYATDHGRKSDLEQRNVFAWGPGHRVFAGTWQFETNDGKNFYIRSEQYNEYLYAASFFWDRFYRPSEKERRHVFTWKRKSIPEHAIWLIIPSSSDTIELKNKYYGEYLYAASLKYFDLDLRGDRRFVFTWTQGNSVRESSWKVEL